MGLDAELAELNKYDFIFVDHTAAEVHVHFLNTMRPVLFDVISRLAEREDKVPAQIASITAAYAKRARVLERITSRHVLITTPQAHRIADTRRNAIHDDAQTVLDRDIYKGKPPEDTSAAHQALGSCLADCTDKQYHLYGLIYSSPCAAEVNSVCARKAQVANRFYRASSMGEHLVASYATALLSNEHVAIVSTDIPTLQLARTMREEHFSHRKRHHHYYPEQLLGGNNANLDKRY